MIPDNERDDRGLPLAIRKLPNATDAEQVVRMKARLKHYGVKNIHNVQDLAGLEAQRVAHNAVITRARERIDNTPRVPLNEKLGFVVGEYRWSNWVPYPHIIFEPPIPCKHAVIARSVDNRLKFSIANYTVDGIPIGAMPYTPSLVHPANITPLEKWVGADGFIDVAKIKEAIITTWDS